MKESRSKALAGRLYSLLHYLFSRYCGLFVSGFGLEIIFLGAGGELGGCNSNHNVHHSIDHVECLTLNHHDRNEIL